VLLMIPLCVGLLSALLVMAGLSVLRDWAQHGANGQRTGPMVAEEQGSRCP
jgi:hypothetical protein